MSSITSHPKADATSDAMFLFFGKKKLWLTQDICDAATSATDYCTQNAN